VNKMKNKTKAIVLASLIVTMVCSGVLLSLHAVSAEEVSPPTGDRQDISYLLKRRDALVMRFLRNGVPEVLEGDVSVVTRVILVVNIEGEAVNVVVPRFWVFNGETTHITDLFDGDPFNLGDEAVLKTLMLKLVKETHTVKSYVAYSIQIEDKTATALQPFNIDVVE
jgi:hypothetical protein